MTRYRKKPVEIEALLFGAPEDAEFIARWAHMDGTGMGLVTAMPVGDHDEPGTYLAIDTLEGTMYASLGDYVIRGVKGEFYPCKPDIFELTYDKVPPVPAPLHIRNGASS